MKLLYSGSFMIWHGIMEMIDVLQRACVIDFAIG